MVLTVTPDAISVVSWHAFALHKCKDNIYAEAFGCLEALRTAHSHVQSALQAGLPSPDVTVQGDILPIVNFLTFKGRFRRLDVLPLLEKCQSLPARLPSINMEYKPRDIAWWEQNGCPSFGMVSNARSRSRNNNDSRPFSAKVNNVTITPLRFLNADRTSLQIPRQDCAFVPLRTAWCLQTIEIP